MDRTLQLAEAACVSVNVLLHSTGCFLLWKTYKRSQITTQKLILLHLSIFEGLINLIFLVMYVMHLSVDPQSESYNMILMYFIQPVTSSLNYVIIFIMLFMTLDRLMAVVLNLRVSRTKKVLVAIWIFGLLLSVCFILLRIYMSRSIYKLIRIIHVYLQLAFSILFVITALLTYAIIFWKYKISRNSLEADSSNGNGQQQHSPMHFYIPLLIVSTYVILNATPYIIGIFIKKSNEVLFMINILHYLGYMSDALIYIFLQPKVRKELFMCCRRRNSPEPSNNITLQSTVDRTVQVNRTK